MSQRILVVEDEPKLAELLKDYLLQSGYEPTLVSDGAHAIEKFNAVQPHLVLLDLMLPNKDGMTICKEIRQTSNTPIIMTTARIDEIDRLLGLELGADDYVCKPYSPREVMARVKAVLRRLQGDAPKTSSILTFNTDKMQTLVKGTNVDLTAVEFHLLHLMAQEPSRIFSRQQLMDKIYDDHRVVSDRTIDSHIKKLRKKLLAVDNSLDLIQSVYGVGYKVELPH